MPEPGDSADELVQWAETVDGAMLGGRRTFKAVEEASPDLAPRLHLIARRALEQAAGSVLPFAPPQLLWAPGRLRVCFHDGWHETDIDGTLASWESAVFSATYAAVEAARDY